ncbi:MAG: anaerobic sulfatase maturase [Clostridiales bacterium GWF2_38_85]|nr:MAG: anaerobic sulfatase maturase [Clostridiales bacterium GWF2_38_85]HBL83624.1 anaerobic sulfatase maturase [Clostridiales bacterium]
MNSITLLIKPVSGLCNLRCKYCFYADVVGNRQNPQYDIMDEGTLETVVRKAFAYSDRYCFFMFQGGEPTLAGLDFYKKLIYLQKLYNRNNLIIQNSIQTNSIILTEEWIEFFHDNNFLVGLSLDGTEEIHNSFRTDAAGNGTYNRVIESIKLLEKYKVDYNILCVVTNKVAQNGKAVYHALKRYRHLQFIPCLDDLDGTECDFSLKSKNYGEFLKITFDEYYNDIKNNSYTSVRNFDNYVRILNGNAPENCSMSGKCSYYFVIDGNGSVYPCDFFAFDKWKIGDVKNDSFIRMTKSDTVTKFVDDPLHINEKCENCRWFFLCKGGCRRNREPFENNIPARNIYCESYIDFFEYTFKRLKEISCISASKISI